MSTSLLEMQESLCEACSDNDIDTCKLLLGRIDPNLELEGYQTPLICAIMSDSADIVELLISHGAELCSFEEGISLLEYCKHDEEMPEVGAKTRAVLFHHGLDPDYILNDTTAFMNAINKGHFSLALEYLDANARVDVIDDNGWTPVNRILSIIAKNCKSTFESTGLDSQSYLDKLNTILMSNTKTDDLLSRTKLSWGMYPQDDADYFQAKREPGIQLIKKLIEKGADVNSANAYGWTPLLYASGSDFLSDICSLLVKSGANVIVSDMLDIYFPLIRACSNNNTQAALMLLDFGADPNVIDPMSGYSPLTYSCIDLNLKLVQRLLEKGADVNSVCHKGSTPLLWMLGVNRRMLHLMHDIDIPKKKPTDENIVSFPLDKIEERNLEDRLEEIETIIRLLLSKNTELFVRNSSGENVYDIINSSFMIERFADLLPPPGPR
tara:strand:- start:4926 stop:6239 length:1314 start_codon:yes stop_codon:yes gene_type:complete